MRDFKFIPAADRRIPKHRIYTDAEIEAWELEIKDLTMAELVIRWKAKQKQIDLILEKHKTWTPFKVK